jgi:hypothetical protein
MHGFNWEWTHGPFWGGGFFMIFFWICLILLIAAVLKGILKGGVFLTGLL